MRALSQLGFDQGVSAPVHWTGERLDSWKEVASYFRREVRTVQLWEKSEGLPVRRQVHQKRGSVYAYRRELEAWWIARSAISSRGLPAPEGQSGPAVRMSQAITQESLYRIGVVKQDTGISLPPAYHACQMGFHFWRQRSKAALIKALGYFEDAIALDPECADAYAGLADTYVSLSYNYLLPSQPAASVAKDAAEKALRLDHKSLQVQNSLINVLINCTWDRLAAERRSLQLIDSGKMDIRTLQLYSTLMNSQGRHDEAISLALHGHRLEPLSDLANGQVAVAYFYAGDYSNALSFVRHTIQVQPQFVMGHALLGRTEAARGNWDQAIHALNRGLALSNRSPSILALLAYAHAGAGDVPTAESMLLELAKCRSGGCFPAYDVSGVYATLNREREALQNMSIAYDRRDMKAIYVNHDPRFSRLRNSHQFRRIASSISAA